MPCRHCWRSPPPPITRIGKIQRLGAEAADRVDQQAHAVRAAQRAQRRKLVEPTRGGLVMHDRQVREAGRLPCRFDPRGDGIMVRRLRPAAG
jgi:hypothetical protein